MFFFAKTSNIPQQDTRSQAEQPVSSSNYYDGIIHGSADNAIAFGIYYLSDEFISTFYNCVIKNDVLYLYATDIIEGTGDEIVTEKHITPNYPPRKVIHLLQDSNWKDLYIQITDTICYVEKKYCENRK